jgi:hypothetical protein
MPNRSLEIRGIVVGGILGLPAGSRLLAAIRTTTRFARAVGLQLRRGTKAPPRARPWKEHDRLVVATRYSVPEPFLSTNQLIGCCRYFLAEDGSLAVNPDRHNNWYFVRTDDVHDFFAAHEPREPFVLFTGHSDLPVDRSHRRYLRRDGLEAWLAVNPVVGDPKLRARPIGVVSPCWANGDPELLRRARAASHEKRRLFHVAFTVESNPSERAYCLAQAGLTLADPIHGQAYFDDLAASYFCISPKGAGIDCCRTWEALAVGTVPVVTRSLVSDQHPDMPMIVLDDWAQFRSIDFSPELYRRTWGDWDPDELLLNRYIGRIERAIADIRARTGRS